MADLADEKFAQIALQHIGRLVNSPSAPELPAELAHNKEMQTLHATLMALRFHLGHIAQGELTQDVEARGFMAGLIKMHLSHLRHLTWQVEQVAQGDFSQKVDFMGDFSKSFNNMVAQLDATLTALRGTEDTLTRLTRSLRHEIELRSTAEARFKYLAEHDSLTGSLNRRSFLALAETELRTAEHRGTPCCVALLDVDYFKKFNDNYGHLEGDAALKHVVKQASAGLRQTDIMGRYGGEEFIFFFSDADRTRGERAAERIRSAIAGKPVQVAGKDVVLTVSIGICVVLPEWEQIRGAGFLQQAIGMADKALYQAKAAGRNRTVTAPVVPPEPSEAEDDIPTGG